MTGTPPPSSWFKAMRGQEAMELCCRAPNAFRLAYVIAHRARYAAGFNVNGLEPGEAMLGDFKACGMSEQEYRTAKGQLQKWKFATFKPTSQGTLGKLMDARLFDPLNLFNHNPTNTPATTGPRTSNEPATTNKKDKKDKKEIREYPKPRGTAERIATESRLKILKARWEELVEDTCEQWQRELNPHLVKEKQALRDQLNALEDSLLEP